MSCGFDYAWGSLGTKPRSDQEVETMLPQRAVAEDCELFEF